MDAISKSDTIQLTPISMLAMKINAMLNFARQFDAIWNKEPQELARTIYSEL